MKDNLIWGKSSSKASKGSGDMFKVASLGVTAMLGTAMIGATAGLVKKAFE